MQIDLIAVSHTLENCMYKKKLAQGSIHHTLQIVLHYCNHNLICVINFLF